MLPAQTFFQDATHKKYLAARKEIEADSFYQPGLHSQQQWLDYLVENKKRKRDENNKARVVIKPSSIKAQSDDARHG